jgi:SAM-dependent methyltransferase
MSKPIDLWRLEPFSRACGADRGTPIDRYYIERFLADNADDIHGRVLEMGDRVYTQKYGGRRVTHSDALFQREGKPGVTIVDDLQTGQNLPSDAFDCVVFTQTFQLLYDSRGAIRVLHRILKPGGVVLATFPGVSQIVRDEQEGWYDYWRWTATGAKRLWSETFGQDNVTVAPFGNLISVMSFISGVALHELKPDELDHRDRDYELSLTLRAVKPPAQPRAARALPATVRTAATLRVALGDAKAGFATVKTTADANVELAGAGGASIAVKALYGADEWGFLSAIHGEATIKSGDAALNPEHAARTAIHIAGPYWVQNAQVGAVVQAGAGTLPAWAGAAAAALAHETAIDDIARQRRADPLDYRAMIAVKRGMPTVADQWLMTAAGLRFCLEAVKPRWQTVRKSGKRGKSGVGVGCGWFGLGPTYGTEPVSVRIERARNGAVTIQADVADPAVGKLLRAIAAKRLGILPARVSIKGRQGFALGRAVDKAALALGSGSSAEALFDPQTAGPDANGLGTPYPLYAFAAAVAEVAVSKKGIEVKRITVAADVGRALDPAAAKARATEGVRDGIALALGKAAARSVRIDVMLVEDPEPQGAFGAIGLGEQAAIATVPAIANAIRAATGKPVTKLPV